MREERLLERILLWKKHPERRGKEDPRRVLDSVLRHLQKILNTRQGSAPIGEDFGVPDFTEFLHDYPESLRAIERTIRHTIQKYEPRLKAVRVNFLPPDDERLVLRFQIAAKLDLEDETLPVVMESLVDPDGKIKLRT